MCFGASHAFRGYGAGCEAVGVRPREGDDFPYFESLGFSSQFVLAEKHLCALDESNQPSTFDHVHDTLPLIRQEPNRFAYTSESNFQELS